MREKENALTLARKVCALGVGYTLSQGLQVFIGADCTDIGNHVTCGPDFGNNHREIRTNAITGRLHPHSIYSLSFYHVKEQSKSADRSFFDLFVTKLKSKLFLDNRAIGENRSNDCKTY